MSQRVVYQLIKKNKTPITRKKIIEKLLPQYSLGTINTNIIRLRRSGQITRAYRMNPETKRQEPIYTIKKPTETNQEEPNLT